jgi:hypothetical protein
LFLLDKVYGAKELERTVGQKELRGQPWRVKYEEAR